MSDFRANFVSASGDRFYIPEYRREEDVRKYKEAVANNDENTMLYYEQGASGWEYIEVA
jgi:hypothetical protein